MYIYILSDSYYSKNIFFFFIKSNLIYLTKILPRKKNDLRMSLDLKDFRLNIGEVWKTIYLKE